MFNVAMRILNHAAEAEDVLQDAFLDAFQKINDFRQNSTFGAWLKQIVVNRAINQLRHRKVDFIDIDDVGDFEDREPFDEEALEFQLNRVQRCILLLPDGYRTVLSLYLLEGYDHEEIAEILGVAESTTRTQYIRAKKKLLEILAKG
jgi:RNA polymerase sigma factor (sigma-70 family)